MDSLVFRAQLVLPDQRDNKVHQDNRGRRERLALLVIPEALARQASQV